MDRRFPRPLDVHIALDKGTKGIRMNGGYRVNSFMNAWEIWDRVCPSNLEMAMAMRFALSSGPQIAMQGVMVQAWMAARALDDKSPPS